MPITLTTLASKSAEPTVRPATFDTRKPMTAHQRQYHTVPSSHRIVACWSVQQSSEAVKRKELSARPVPFCSSVLAGRQQGYLA